MEKQKTKLAFLVDSMAGGGAERVTLNLANEYCEQGYAVDLVLAHKEGPYLADVNSNIRIIDLNTTRFWTYLLPLIRYFRNEKPDVMLSATTILNVIAIVTKLLSLSKARLVISEHINIISFAKTGGLQRPKFVQKVMKFFYPYADQIVAVSNGAADDLSIFSGIKRQRITAIYNGVVDQHKLDLAKETVDHPWFNNGGNDSALPPVIVAVGRLQAQKDYKMLLKAFTLLNTKIDSRLIILGEGELREDLDEMAENLQISEKVSLHGFEANPFKYLANADVFALSSLYEGLPTVLIEALACGCPVVSTNCPSGPEEILEGGEYGHLTPIGDEQIFADAMLTVLQDSNIDRERLRRHGQQFTVDKAFIEYSKVLGL